MSDMKFPQLLDVGERIINVDGFIESGKHDFVPGKGYIHEKDNMVYIFIPKDQETKFEGFMKYPRFNIDRNLPIFYKSSVEDINKLFDAEKIGLATYESILEDIESGKSNEALDIHLIRDMNASLKIFKPVIMPEDDFLKKLVKTAILDKQIDINIYRSVMDKKHGITNLKAPLTNSTKLNPVSFSKWAELLGFDFELRIFDNGTDIVSPLSSDITFSSTTGKITHENGEEDESYEGLETTDDADITMEDIDVSEDD